VTFSDTSVVLVFRNDRSGSAATINSWVAEKTNDKVKDIVTGDNIDEFTRLILVNAIYFKGDWLNKFDASLTEDADFHISPSEMVKVKMMFRKSKMKFRKRSFLYGANEDLLCHAVELPYARDTLTVSTICFFFFVSIFWPSVLHVPLYKTVFFDF